MEKMENKKTEKRKKREKWENGKTENGKYRKTEKIFALLPILQNHLIWLTGRLLFVYQSLAWLTESWSFCFCLRKWFPRYIHATVICEHIWRGISGQSSDYAGPMKSLEPTWPLVSITPVITNIINIILWTNNVNNDIILLLWDNILNIIWNNKVCIVIIMK